MVDSGVIHLGDRSLAAPSPWERASRLPRPPTPPGDGQSAIPAPSTPSLSVGSERARVRNLQAFRPWHAELDAAQKRTHSETSRAFGRRIRLRPERPPSRGAVDPPSPGGGGTVGRGGHSPAWPAQGGGRRRLRAGGRGRATTRAARAVAVWGGRARRRGTPATGGVGSADRPQDAAGPGVGSVPRARS